MIRSTQLSNSDKNQQKSLHTSHLRTSHSTGVGDHGRWSTRRIAMYALLTALSMALSLISLPLIPAAPFLKYDPSGIVVLLASLLYGPTATFCVGILGFLPHFLTNPIGAIINVCITLTFALPVAFAARKQRKTMSTKQADKPLAYRTLVTWLTIGAVLAVVVALVLNVFATPLYAKMTVQQVAVMILPILLPFNLLKCVIDVCCTVVLYKPIRSLLTR